MAQSNFSITIKILDEWTIDSYSIRGYLIYMLVEIADKLYLLEKYLNDIEY
jgi:hypothetical protein